MNTSNESNAVEVELARMRALPTLNYGGRLYTVDFRLEELRYVASDGWHIEFIPFVDIADEKLKSILRGMRFRCWYEYHMKGLDD